MIYNNIMKKLCFDKRNTKRGLASFYVVIFATILFGIVTVSFIRIILSEATQSSNDDLSRSAYDSAIAGVEDAKTAINRYYSCINGTGLSSDCESSKYELLFGSSSRNCENGIGVAKYLYGENYNDGDNENVEVKIQESNPDGSNSDTVADQAYTCVVVSDAVPDYRGTLTGDTPTKAIPLGVYNEVSNTTSTKLDEVKKVSFSWFSKVNEGDKSRFITSDGKTLNAKSNATVPPTIVLTFIKMKKGVTTEDFHNLNNSSKLVYSTMLLLPTGNFVDRPTNEISYDVVQKSGNVNTENSQNVPKKVTCSLTNDFACSIDITGLSFEKTDSAFLIASLPYNDTAVDFSATLYNGKNEPIEFVGVQVQVDSTGRTNQLVRRVEARLDPTDLFFPYPEYELFLDGDSQNSLNKKFWITANCWHTHPLDSTNGNEFSAVPKYCPNNSDINISD